MTVKMIQDLRGKNGRTDRQDTEMYNKELEDLKNKQTIQ